MLIFGMKAHIFYIHLPVAWSRSPAKVKFKYQGHISKKKPAVSGVLVLQKGNFFFSHGVLIQKTYCRHVKTRACLGKG